jgi:transposase InsO family protein
MSSRTLSWSEFEALPDSVKTEARKRLEQVNQIERLRQHGFTIGEVSTTVGVSQRTAERLIAAVRNVSPHDRALALAPRRRGTPAPKAEINPDAWDMIRADYLRPEAPSLAACYDRAGRVAKALNWSLPSIDTIRARIRDIPEPVRLLAREGKDALKARYPAQTRDKSMLHAVEAVNADGHRFDVFVRWPDGTIARPTLVAFQDIYSGNILSHRVDQTEHKDLIRLALGDLIERYGIPSDAYLDNGRGFASKLLSGGTATRFRFKVREEDPEGIFSQLGVDVHWTLPYSGQSKPIERAFRDFCDRIAKHPAFAGAYTGNSPDAKPENYKSRAVDLDAFLQVIDAEIAHHNARTGRRSAVCRGRSFDQAFAESYERSTIRRATAEQRRLWLLAAEAVTVSRDDGGIRLAGNRYWSEITAPLAGQKVTVRFDPDRLHESIHCYSLQGKYLGEAECIAPVGFNDTTAAREHARARRQWMKARKAELDAERRMSVSDVASLLPAPADPPPVPAAKVTRPKFGDALTRTTRRDPQDAEREAQFQRVVSDLWANKKRQIL